MSARKRKPGARRVGEWWVDSYGRDGVLWEVWRMRSDGITREESGIEERWRAQAIAREGNARERRRKR